MALKFPKFSREACLLKYFWLCAEALTKLMGPCCTLLFSESWLHHLAMASQVSTLIRPYPTLHCMLLLLLLLVFGQICIAGPFLEVEDCLQYSWLASPIKSGLIIYLCIRGGYDWGGAGVRGYPWEARKNGNSIECTSSEPKVRPPSPPGSAALAMYTGNCVIL